MNIQAIRTELMAAAPSGWNGYDTVPGSATLPALVVALPETVTFDASLRSATIALPIFLAVGPNISPDAEKSLLAKVSEVAAAYLGIGKGTNFRSCRLVRITDFQTLTIGASEVYGCAIDLEVIANT